ncbi:hypothetical protein G4B88_020615 [Cannabis sativa]|uniref:Uncharacterized protein n=1 Tax=Cannabis sativa TaxID=3483 RepID=A0A7J6EL47_CANSA|nr:hypothetical protein G4B88_020615 [Cannabis sativa]
MGFIANMVSLVIYFIGVMHFDNAGASNTLTNFMGTTFLLSLVGGFISDTYLSRLTTCLIFGALEILALMLMTIQAGTHHLQPEIGSGVKGGVSVLLYVSLYLLALGSGGVRGSLTPLGADQFDNHNPKEAKALATFFNWLLLSITLGASIGVTVIVYLNTEKGWQWGFMASTLATFFGFIVLALGKPYYRLRPPGDSPLLSITKVIVVSIKNRGLSLPESSTELYEISEKDSLSTKEKLPHTNQFSTILMNTCLAQLQTFSVEQGALFMDRHIGSKEIPAPSVPVIPLLFMSILLPMYELIFVPFARKITGIPTGITQLQRVGVGLVLSAVSMAVAGLVEMKRRNQAHKDPFNPISIFWLSFQYGIFGIADMFTLVGLLEFFYKEAPASMKSLSTSFTWLTLSFGYFLSTIFVNVINAVTKRVTPSKQQWLCGYDLNSSKLHFFYWFLAILSCLNFFLYLWAAVWYKYKPEKEGNQTTSFGTKNDDDTTEQHSRVPMLPIAASSALE